VAPAPPPPGSAGWGGVLADEQGAAGRYEQPKEEQRKPEGGCLRRWVERVLRQEEPKCQAPLLVYRGPAQGGVAGISAIVFGVLAAIMLNCASDSWEKSIEYATNDTSVAFDLEEAVEGPLLLSYELPELYVNSKRFVESKDHFLVGSLISKYTCEGAQDLDDIRWRRYLGSCAADGVCSRVERAGAFRPCGLVALSMFTDRYELVHLDSGSNISLVQRDVALPRDADIFENKIVRTEGSSGSDFTVEGQPSWLEAGDFFEHFKVWYRTPPSPRLRNLWARIEGPLRSGRYELRFVENNAVWTDAWIATEEPKKRVLLSQVHTLGSRGSMKLLGVVCTVFSCGQVVMTFFFFALPLFKD